MAPPTCARRTSGSSEARSTVDISSRSPLLITQAQTRLSKDPYHSQRRLWLYASRNPSSSAPAGVAFVKHYLPLQSSSPSLARVSPSSIRRLDPFEEPRPHRPSPRRISTTPSRTSEGFKRLYVPDPSRHASTHPHKMPFNSTLSSPPRRSRRLRPRSQQSILAAACLSQTSPKSWPHHASPSTAASVLAVLTATSSAGLGSKNTKARFGRIRPDAIPQHSTHSPRRALRVQGASTR